MSTNVVAFPANFGAVSTRFAPASKEDSLASGVQQGFGIVRIRGKAWTISYRGNETTLMRPDGDGPMNSIEAIILKASGHVSKVWYENGYKEGSKDAPDCFAPNGVTPDPSARKKQSNACAICPKNQWGARINAQGKAVKACGDSKRIVIVPLQDIANEGSGGPMLLRIPATSLSDLAGYGEKMQAMGYPYYAIGTRLSFDPKSEYPKVQFGPIRPLTDAEADLVLQMRDLPQVTRILAEGSEFAAEAPTPELVFEQPPAQPAPVQIAPVQIAPQPAPAPARPTSGFGGVQVQSPPEVTQPAPKPAPAPVRAAPAPAPVAAAPAPAVDQSDFEKALDAQLNDLLPS